MTARRTQRGLGALAAVVVLVMLSLMAATIVRLGTGQQTVLAQDLLAERAAQAARAGIEWGLHQAFKGSWTTCAGSSQTLDLTADTGMRVTVSCSATAYNEGEQDVGTARTVRVYTIDAVACPASTCPDAAMAAQPGYVERRRQVHATD